MIRSENCGAFAITATPNYPKKDLEHNLMVCPVCDYHFRISARERIKLVIDEGTFEEKFSNIKGTDPLEFVDTKPYQKRKEEDH